MPAVLKRPAAAAPALAAKKQKQAVKLVKPLKEAAGAKPAKEAKAPPQPKRDPLLVKVAAGLALATDVPEAAKAMLDDALENSLGAFKEERHPYQASIVGVIQDTLGAVEKGLQASLDGVQADIARIEETKASAATAIEQSEAKLEDQRAEVCRKKHELANIARAFKAAREAVSDVKLGQEDAERDLKKATGDKQQLETALADYFRPLLAEGSTSGDTMGEEKVDNLVRILKRFSFDESMTSALPTALLKEPGARGPFDTMVLSQLEAEVAKRVAGIDAAIAEAEPARTERAANLERAEAHFADAKAKQLESAKVFQEAKREEELRQEAVQEAKKAASEAGKEARRLQREADKGQRALSSFREGPLAAFEQLRDCSAPAPPAAEEEVEAPAAEAAEVETETVEAAEQEAAEQEEVAAMDE